MQNKRKERIFLDPIFRNNPVTVQILGICSALAVTVKLQSAVVMALSLTFVVAFSNVIVSFLRKTIPGRIRIIVQLVVVAFLVIVVDQFLKAYFFDISKQLSVFVGLIITNCIVMGRLEAFAMSNSPKRSLIDGLANGLGYGFILIVVAFFRELLGSGTIWNYQVVPQAFYDAGYMNNGLMIMPPMALIAVGIIVWIQRAHQQRKEEGK